MLLNDILSVLGLNSGYTVKYTPSPSGVPSASPSGTPSGEGVYLTVYLSSRLNTDTIISHEERKRGQNIFSFQGY